MSDQQLTMIGYISVVWNALERHLVACIWSAAGWPQDIGELVTADLGDVSRCDLLANLANRIKGDDDRIVSQTIKTLALYDHVRAARNDLMHGFYNFREQGWPLSHELKKFTAKRRSGSVEMKSVGVALPVLEELAADLFTCNDSLDDLYHKFLFRGRFLNGERGVFAQNYEDAVHGWRAPAFDIARVQEAVARRSKLRNPPQDIDQCQSSRA
jgi:hypothetical protein